MKHTNQGGGRGRGKGKKGEDILGTPPHTTEDVKVAGQKREEMHNKTKINRGKGEEVHLERENK